MAIDDPYDRSGQYQGGDRGPKVEGYSPLSPDQRDYAVATMLGEGFDTTATGRGGILDSIVNRQNEMNRGLESYGIKGGTDFQGIVLGKTPKGVGEYNTWDKNQKNAYGMAMRGLQGNPRAGAETGWYDQSMDVYDSYFHDPFSPYKGVAGGGTFYQLDSIKNKAAGAWQAQKQNEWGSVPLDSYHVATGPNLFSGGYGWDDFGSPAWADEMVQGQPTSASAVPVGQTVQGYEETSFAPTPREDRLFDNLQPTGHRAGFGEDPYGGSSVWGRSAAVDDQIMGGYGQSLLGGNVGQPLGPQSVYAAGRTVSPVDYARAIKGMSSAATPDFTGSAGAGDPYGIGGFGWNEPGSVSQVVSTTFDPKATGPMFADSGWQSSPQAADRAAGVPHDAAAWGGLPPGSESVWGTVPQYQGGPGPGAGDGGTGNTGMGEGGSLGDGSYSDSAGYNDNSPQGIL